MVVVKHGWSEEIAFSTFTKEASYDAGVTVNDTNYSSLAGFEATVEWPDRIESDKGEVTGLEFGTQQNRLEQMVNITVNEPHARPNTLAGLGALVLGSVSSTQDGITTAYRHDITPIAVGSGLPSISCVHQKGGLQYKYDGVKGNKLTISGEAGGPVVCNYELMGSGTRATNADTMPSVISESWMLYRSCKVWLESGANISITAQGSGVQQAEDISSATPEDLGARIKSFSWAWMNNAERQASFGSGSGAALDIDKGRRTAELSFDLLFDTSTELDYFINQNPLAVEFDLAGGVIDGAGLPFYYGFTLVVPQFYLKAAPVATGGVDDRLMVTLDCEIITDGTNPASWLSVYNAQTGYLA